MIAFVLPLDTFAHMCYFTMRSGGMTGVTFLFDSCFSWVVNVPVAFALARFTALPIVPLYAVSASTVLLKDVIGLIMLRRRMWVNTLTGR